MTDAIEKLQAAIAKAAEDKKAEQDSQTAADVAQPAAEDPLLVAEPQAAQAADEPVEPAADAPASSDAIAVAPDAPGPAEPVLAAQAANQSKLSSGSALYLIEGVVKMIDTSSKAVDEISGPEAFTAVPKGCQAGDPTEQTLVWKATTRNEMKSLNIRRNS